MAKILSVSIVGSLLLSGVALAQGPAKLTEEVKAKARANQEQAQRERDRNRRIEGSREYDHHRYSEPQESRKHERDHDRDHVRHDPFRKVSEHPKGWEHGRKTGWGNCDVPPGQAKKQGCHPYHNHSVHPVRTASRKPIVAPRPAAEVHAHAGVDAKVH